MVKIGRLPPRRQEPTPRSTPFDMLTVNIGGTAAAARPYEIATDADTGTQYPAMAVTSCPMCGHGIHFQVRRDLLLSGMALTAACTNCGAGVVAPPQALADPFRNPITDGIVKRSEVDPLYTDPADLHEVLPVSGDAPTAAERVKSRRKPRPGPAAPAGISILPLPPDGQDGPVPAHDVPSAGAGILPLPPDDQQEAQEIVLGAVGDHAGMSGRDAGEALNAALDDVLRHSSSGGEEP